MPKYNRILVPVDLSDNSLISIELATTLAIKHNAKILFLYVTTVWDPDRNSQFQDYAKQVIEEDKTQLYKLRPSDPSVEFEHTFIHGNPGPEIVKASKKADSIVMSTHGKSGIIRFIMGSVANYVLRNAKCSVILVKGTEISKTDSQASTDEQELYVTAIMHQVSPIHSFETMDSVLAELTKARETAAPVVDGLGMCTGILTTTDINKYLELQKRFDEKDESVIDEMFEVNKYGQRRVSAYNFDQVERHMTKEVICLQDTDSVQKAIKLFEANPEIHHLVVLDEDKHAVGIIDALDVVGAEFVELGEATS